MSVIFSSVVQNLTSDNRIVGRVRMQPGERKVIRFYDMPQILIALDLQREGKVVIETDVPTELISDFQIFSCGYSEKDNAILISIHGGNAYIEETIVRVDGMNYQIPSPATNTLYHLFVDSTGTFHHAVAPAENQDSMLLWGIGTGAKLSQILMHDLRYFLSKDTAGRLDDMITGNKTLWSSQKIANELATKSDIGHTHLSADITDLDAHTLGVIGTVKGQPNGLATLGSDGLIPIAQIPASFKEIKVVNTIADRDALVGYEGLRVHVIDATGDATVSSGWAEYLWVGGAWTKTADIESIDVVLDWSNIQNGPTSAPADIDDAVTKRHTHPNLTVLGNLSDSAGQLYYNGTAVGGSVTFTNFLNAGGDRKTIVFVIPNITAAGPQAPEIRFPFFGKVVDVSASCITPATSGTTEIQVEYCSDFNYTAHNAWSEMLTTNMTIDAGSRVMSTGVPPVIDPAAATIISNNYFRVNFLSVGTGIAGVTIEVTIQFYQEG